MNWEPLPSRPVFPTTSTSNWVVCGGAGGRLYRSGPWHSGTPTQGYQLPYTPAELFRACLRAISEQHFAGRPQLRP
jgi:hypothetical protein